MRVLYVDPKPCPELEALGAKQVELDTLLTESDFVCLHCCLCPSTQHLIGEKQFHMMKPTSFLINMARGPVIDELALVHALNEHTIGGAALDVYEHEPQLSPGLAEAPNCLLVPHIGSSSIETR